MLKETSKCCGFQQLTGMSSATGLTLPGNTGEAIDANFVLLQAEAQAVRWRDDGTDPTASVGMILNVGDMPYPYDGDLSKIKFIQAVSGAKLNVSYYR